MADLLRSILVVCLLLAACYGGGALLLRLSGWERRLSAIEHAGWGLGLGLGLLGWSVFFLGITGKLNPAWLAGLCAVLAVPLVLLYRRRGSIDVPAPTPTAPTAAVWLLGLGLAAILAVDFIEALAPPADADTTAYHFALAKDFLQAGSLFFVPRAVDGAIPLLVQMTYVPALALGGERALTLWTMASGWLPALPLFAIARRFLPASWTLAVVVLFLSVPAMVSGAGSGQVEARLAVFGLLGAFAVVDLYEREDLGAAAIAGLAAGFFAGAKYTGLMYVVACGLAILWHRRRVPAVAIYAGTALAAGFQWYVWNWINSGDPVFPMLYGLLGLPDSAVWNAAQDQVFRAFYFPGELSVPVNLLWFFAYPFQVVLGAADMLQSQRAGLGLFLISALPFAALGALAEDRAIFRHRLMPALAIVVIFYTLWYFSGSSQRVRHLLPLYPVVLVVVTVAAAHWCSRRSFHAPLVAAATLVIGVYLGGQALWGLRFGTYLFTGMSRDEFLSRNVSNYAAVKWVNDNLNREAKVLHSSRQLNYFFRVPYFLARGNLQTIVNLRPDANDPRAFLREIRAIGVTHILHSPPIVGSESSSENRDSALVRLTRGLYAAHCVKPIATFDVTAVASRTLPAAHAKIERAQVLQLIKDGCRLADAS